MSSYEVGSIVEGKVTAIKPFGAFVALDEEKQGLVHISQVAHGFVKDINEHLSVGEDVKVKILSVDEESGKISLSIREAEPKPERQPQRRKTKQKSNNNTQGFNTLEEKLKMWLKESNEIHADLNRRMKK